MAITPAKRLTGGQQDATTTGKGINTRVPAATQPIRTGTQVEAAKKLGIHAQKGTKDYGGPTNPIRPAPEAARTFGTKVTGATSLNGGATA